MAATVGGAGDKAETILDYGIGSIITTINDAIDIEEALRRTKELCISAVNRIFGMLKAGISLGRK